MLTLQVRNVNHALFPAFACLRDRGVKMASRGGKTVIEYPEPVTTVYEQPEERVLFCPKRDANPFFHLLESVWILRGRNDVGFLRWMLPRFAEFSDDGATLHGAYGYRLRGQIELAVALLRTDPDTRRAVLQLWDHQLDLGSSSRDLPCNTMVFLKLREGQLNITVACRSNDAVWGAYGANAVQFSMLQEYIAAKLGVRVGVYTQISDSFHVYTDLPFVQMAMDQGVLSADPYEEGDVFAAPLFNGDNAEDEEMEQLLLNWDNRGYGVYLPRRYSTPVVSELLCPALNAYIAYRDHRDLGEANGFVETISKMFPDWRRAMTEWLDRRAK